MTDDKGNDRDEPDGKTFADDWTRLIAGPFADMLEGPMRQMVELQTRAAQDMLAMVAPDPEGSGGDSGESSETLLDGWTRIGRQMQETWACFLAESPGAGQMPFGDPSRFLDISGKWLEGSALGDKELQQRLLTDALAIWSAVLGRMSAESANADDEPALPDLPRADRRFADPKWRDQPFYALMHQSYLAMAEEMMAAAERSNGLPPERQEQLRFYTRITVEALSPAHFPLTNPLVMEKIVETGGRSLFRGIEHMVTDMKAGQLTHTQAGAFELGKNIAATPGHVVYQTELFQLIQYTPTTDRVLAVPLVIFPPWINRYYILDLGRKKSFIAWAVDQGISTFVVSWKSADASMAEIGWEDYIAAQEEAIDAVRERLKVPAVHTIGYCVAGTTLAATLAVLDRRDEAEKAKSATFFTAQVDFAEAGDLRAFIDEHQLAAIDSLSSEGFVDGRYLAATFNLLRSPDLIWSYVIRNYLLGEDYTAFDLLHWNGDTTNLPARFHREYLKWLYHDNRLVVPDALVANGTGIDLRRVKTPVYIQAGQEDHIAPAASVWKMTRHLSGPMRFMLAGSGHIAGVVNPPAGGKYQYWTIGDPGAAGDELPDTIDEFVASAKETPGSWWPDWVQWLVAQDATTVASKGKRKPGSRGDKTIEPAPGHYVRSR